MSFDYEEIERAVRDNRLAMRKMEGADKERVIRRLYEVFVSGDPRALWLSFKYVPSRLDCRGEDPYYHLPDRIDANAVFYFVIDYWNRDFVVYEARMADIHTFIGDCEGLDEYYLVPRDFGELYAITDHDDLLYIDVRKNERRLPAAL